MPLWPTVLTANPFIKVESGRVVPITGISAARLELGVYEIKGGLDLVSWPYADCFLELLPEGNVAKGFAQRLLFNECRARDHLDIPDGRWNIIINEGVASLPHCEYVMALKNSYGGNSGLLSDMYTRRAVCRSQTIQPEVTASIDVQVPTTGFLAVQCDAWAGPSVADCNIDIWTTDQTGAAEEYARYRQDTVFRMPTAPGSTDQETVAPLHRGEFVTVRITNVNVAAGIFAVDIISIPNAT